MIRVNQMCVICSKQPTRRSCLRSEIITLTVSVVSSCTILFVQKTLKNANQLLAYKKLSKINKIDLLQANQHVLKKQKNVKNYKTKTLIDLTAVDPSFQPLLHNTMETVQLNKMCVICGKVVRDQKCVRRQIITQMMAANKPCDLLCLQKNNMYIYN